MIEQPQPGDDRPPGDDLTWAESFVIPDDISSLEADVEAWRREQAENRRKARRRRLEGLFPHRARQFGVTAPMLIVTLLVVGGLGAAMIFLGPRGAGPEPQVAKPLATPTVPDGTLGGLVPASTLTSRGGDVISLRALRPAVLTLIPNGCACAQAISHINAVVYPYGIQQYVIAPTLLTLTAMNREDLSANGLVDGGVLRRVYGGEDHKPTIVVIGANGVVRAIEIGANPETALNEDLDAALSGPLLSPSSA